VKKAAAEKAAAGRAAAEKALAEKAALIKEAFAKAATNTFVLVKEGLVEASEIKASVAKVLADKAGAIKIAVEKAAEERAAAEKAAEEKATAADKAVEERAAAGDGWTLDPAERMHQNNEYKMTNFRANNEHDLAPVKMAMTNISHGWRSMGKLTKTLVGLGAVAALWLTYVEVQTPPTASTAAEVQSALIKKLNETPTEQQIYARAYVSGMAYDRECPGHGSGDGTQVAMQAYSDLTKSYFKLVHHHDGSITQSIPERTFDQSINDAEGVVAYGLRNKQKWCDEMGKIIDRILDRQP